MALVTALVLAISLFAVGFEGNVEAKELPPIQTKKFKLVFQVVEELPAGRAAQAIFAPDMSVCVIQVLPQFYSHECLGHELRHCLEGHWHSQDEVVPCDPLQENTMPAKKKSTKKSASPTPKNKALYSKVKAEAKKKFDVYPSAYANAWLVREYKKRGGKY